MYRCHSVFLLALSLCASAKVALAGGDPPVAKPEILTNSIGMKLAKIPAGEFLMGAPESDKDAQPDEKPQHKVKITKPFYMGVYTVTVGQFRAFIKDSGHEIGRGAWRTITPALKLEPGTAKHDWANPGFEISEEHPVVNVDFPDAEAFCRWLSKKEGKTYRLPTEAEWEHACRAGTTTRWSCGDDRDSLVEFANIAYDSFPKYARSDGPKSDLYLAQAPVGKFKPNPWGLYDMHGNVWQWCADWYEEDYYQKSPGADPTGAAKDSSNLRVLRGGNFARGPLDCRSSNRGRLSAGTSLWIGFRVAAEFEEGKPDRTEPKKPAPAKEPISDRGQDKEPEEVFRRLSRDELTTIAGVWEMPVDAKSGWKGWIRMKIVLYKDIPEAKRRVDDGLIQFDYELRNGTNYSKVTSTFPVFVQAVSKGKSLFLVDVSRASSDTAIKVKPGGTEETRLALSLHGERLTVDAAKGHKAFFTQGLVECELPWSKMEWVRVKEKK
jgi:formylglycine-generating enzyme required for sulfatase activity